MDKTNKHLEDISEMRSLMESSARFISLSGLSGIFTGIYALIGALIAYWYIGEYYPEGKWYYEYSYGGVLELVTNDFVIFFLLDGISVLLLSLGTCIFLTTKKARRKGIKIWDKPVENLLYNLMIPLIVGGIFCFNLLTHKMIGMIAPSTLIFYGLALVNSSKYTFDDIRYLGISEILIGLLASWYIGYGLIFWAVGFGVLHIIYGILMYYKHEKGNG